MNEKTIALAKKEVDDFLRAKGYHKSTVQNMSSVIRMLDKMGIRTKEAVWDRFYRYSSSYRKHLYLHLKTPSAREGMKTV